MDARDDALGRTPRREPIAGSPLGDDSLWVVEEFVALRSSFTIDETIAGMRLAFAAWLAAGERLDDVVLAVYEVMANVADHAYADTPGGVGTVGLAAHRAHELLRITVSDHGRWRAATEAPSRSRYVIGLLIERVHIETTTSGTVVHLQSIFRHPGRRAEEALSAHWLRGLATRQQLADTFTAGCSAGRVSAAVSSASRSISPATT